MIVIETDEQYQWLLDAFESDVFQVVSRKRTEEEWEEISRELAEYKAAHPKVPAKEAVLA